MIVARHEVPGLMGKNSPVPAGRLNGSRLRLDANKPFNRDTQRLQSGMNSVSTTNISDHDFDRPSGTGASLHRYPGTSCLYVFSVISESFSSSSSSSSSAVFRVAGTS
jgi:hypothetical protein